MPESQTIESQLLEGGATDPPPPPPPQEESNIVAAIMSVVATRIIVMFYLLPVRKVRETTRWPITASRRPARGIRNTGEHAMLVAPEQACGVYIGFVGPA